MSSQPFSPDTTVEEAITAGHAADILIRHHTACVGCYLARFCTLREVAAAYHLSLEGLLEELSQAALAKPFQLTGANNAKES